MSWLSSPSPCSRHPQWETTKSYCLPKTCWKPNRVFGAKLLEDYYYYYYDTTTTINNHNNNVLHFYIIIMMAVMMMMMIMKVSPNEPVSFILRHQRTGTTWCHWFSSAFSAVWELLGITRQIRKMCSSTKKKPKTHGTSFFPRENGTNVVLRTNGTVMSWFQLDQPA